MTISLRPHQIAAEQARSVGSRPRGFVFLLLPSFSAFDYSSAVEALAEANRFDGADRYAWRTVSADGAPVRAPNGIAIAVDGGLAPLARGETVIVFGGASFRADSTPAVVGWLRGQARTGATVGGVGGAAYTLAQAGLLGQRKVAAHWSYKAALREAHPGINVCSSIFNIDGRAMTCAGGVSTLDLMLQLIAEDQGRDVATWVADRLVCSTPRTSQHCQTIAEHCRTGVRHEKLSRALELMQNELEDPWSPAEVAAMVGISTRQLERLFSKYLNATPKVFYTRLRLENARILLQQTNMKIIEVALANGFNTAAHFARVYRSHFGVSPHTERGLGDG